MNSLLDEDTRQKLFTNLDICFKKSDGLPSILYPMDNKVSLFSIFFLKLLFFSIIEIFSAMARSLGPKLFWASPNCFGHGSKCKIQYEKDFLVRSKTNWTWLGLGIEANFFQVSFFMK